MTDADKVIELSEKCTPLPWEITDREKITQNPAIGHRGGPSVATVWQCGDRLLVNGHRPHNAAYIVAACNSAPALSRDSQALQRVREILETELPLAIADAKAKGDERVEVRLTVAEAHELLKLLTP